MSENDHELVMALRSDLAGIKTLATCSICDQLLYEPWTLGCGHTYCYSCLCNWFIPNKRNKTCPECRASCNIIPAPAFLLKQIVEILIKGDRSMPSDESVEQHMKKRSEEIAMVEEDKNGPNGLFKGVFPDPGTRGEVWMDEEDGILRCPGCGHEYEGGSICAVCGLELVDAHYDFSDTDEDVGLDALDDLELDLDIELRSHHFIPVPNFGFSRAIFQNHHMHSTGQSETSESEAAETTERSEDEEDEEEEEEEEEGSLLDFIVHDEIRRGHRPTTHGLAIGITSRQVTITSDDDSDEGGQVTQRRQRQRGLGFTHGPNRVMRNASSESSAAVADESTSDSDTSDLNPEEAMLRNAGWSPLDQENEGEPAERVAYDDYCASQSGNETEDESDTDTMVGYNAYAEDEHSYFNQDSSYIHRCRHADLDTASSYSTGNHTEEERDSMRSEILSVIDPEGDTEMSASSETQRNSDGDRPRSIPAHSRKTRRPNTHREVAYDDNDSNSSDSSIRPPTRRIPKTFLSRS